MAGYNSTTTLRKISEKYFECGFGWPDMFVLLRAFGDLGLDEPIDLITILDKAGIDEALFVLSYASPDERLSRHMHAWIADLVIDLFQSQCPNDDRVRRQIEALRNDDLSADDRFAARQGAIDAEDDLLCIDTGGQSRYKAIGAASVASAFSPWEAAVATRENALDDDAWDKWRQMQSDELRRMLKG